jgi:demethoxyubiquinone hydroxylase (CLK1/Coq7/Cat5 family)
MLQNQERLRLYEFQVQLVMNMSNKGPLSLWRRRSYAGGIISAAIDGKCAVMIGESLNKKIQQHLNSNRCLNFI